MALDSDRPGSDHAAESTSTLERGPEIRAGSFGQPVDNLLTPEQQERIRRYSTLLTYRRRAVIFSELEDARFIYFVRDGVIRISRNGENGRRQILTFGVPGDVFGIPDGGHYANSAEAVCASQLYRVSWRRMEVLMAEDPQLQWNLLNRLSYDLRQAQARIMSLGVQTTNQRLASFLLEQISVPNCFNETRRVLKLAMNRYDVADYLGTTPESASRAFAVLEHARLIRRGRARIVEILDIKGLKGLLKRGDSTGTRPRAAASTKPVCNPTIG